jgi:hypothetical protein
VAQKLASRRGVKEQALDVDRGSHIVCDSAKLSLYPALYDNSSPLVINGGTSFDRQTGYGADAGKGFTAKAQGSDCEQIRGGSHLAGGMPFNTQFHVLAGHAESIINDSDRLAPAIDNVGPVRFPPVPS